MGNKNEKSSQSPFSDEVVLEMVVEVEEEVQVDNTGDLLKQ